jgi:hypothetical protein
VLVDEPLGVPAVGVGEDLRAVLADALGQAVVHVVGGVEADAGVPVVVVVPLEELSAPLSALFSPSYSARILALYAAGKRRVVDLGSTRGSGVRRSLVLATGHSSISALTSSIHPVCLT